MPRVRPWRRKTVASRCRRSSSFDAEWPAVEGSVRVKSRPRTPATENDMAQVQALLASQPSNMAEADAVLGRMRDRLAPIVATGGTYGVFDAFVILLREGLEALLVVGALLTFLTKSGNRDKRGWIWGGVGVGVALSLVLAVILQQVFGTSRRRAGQRDGGGDPRPGCGGDVVLRQLLAPLQGPDGRVAEIHRRANHYGLARGSMLSLALIAMLAVFREGAEIHRGLLSWHRAEHRPGRPGTGRRPGRARVGCGGHRPGGPGEALAAATVLPGVERADLLPGLQVRRTGIHALQVAGIVGSTPAFLPSNDTLGLYPTWETTLPQLALLCLAAAVLWISVQRQRRAPTGPPLPV